MLLVLIKQQRNLTATYEKKIARGVGNPIKFKLTDEFQFTVWACIQLSVDQAEIS